MTSAALRLAHAPIIEAVIDINCDLPPDTDFGELQERAADALRASYPKLRRQITQRHELGLGAAESPEVAMGRKITRLLLLTEDERQLVQFRSEGYSFNRLAPYGSLDEYLRDIEWTWEVFRELARPVQIRAIGLRFINRILLPTNDGLVELNDYLRVSPQLPDEETLQFTGFLNQHAAVEITTGNHVNITLVMEALKGDKLPIIFDIATSDLRPKEPEAWQDVREAIESLRRLKNRIFERTLTESCLNLFQQP